MPWQTVKCTVDMMGGRPALEPGVDKHCWSAESALVPAAPMSLAVGGVPEVGPPAALHVCCAKPGVLMCTRKPKAHGCNPVWQGPHIFFETCSLAP